MRQHPFILILAAIFMAIACPSHARLGTEYQMQLGNPTEAKADTNNHEHYLVQRRVFAMDYDDHESEPNWVSWDLTAEDMGPAKRSPGFHSDPELPVTFHHVKSADYKGSGFDRGHMCPSADRTDNAEDNDAVFTMANIIPQAPDNNQGVWEKLEADCRDWAKAGNELLIVCGPADFNGQNLQAGDPVAVPSHTWKIVVIVPEGPGSVISRITAATRVIAVNIPNISGVRNDPWTKYSCSVGQIEAMTGFRFFTALAPNLAQALKAKVDGQATPVAVQATVVAQTRNADPAPGQTEWVPVAIVVLSIVLVLVIVVMALFYRKAKQNR